MKIVSFIYLNAKLDQLIKAISQFTLFIINGDQISYTSKLIFFQLQ